MDGERFDRHQVDRESDAAEAVGDSDRRATGCGRTPGSEPCSSTQPAADLRHMEDAILA
jgi:hypothetical protein